MAAEFIPTYGIDFFRNSKQSTKPYQIEHFESKRQFSVAYPHRHKDFFEILFITNGSGSYTIDFKTYNITPSCIFFLAPGQVHDIKYSKDIDGFIMLFTEEFYHLNKKQEHSLLEFPFFYNLEDENPPLPLTNNQTGFLKQLFEQGILSFNADNPDDNLIMSILDMILSYAANIYPKTKIDKQEQSKGKLLVKRFKKLLEEHYHENYDVSNYAEMLSVTPNYLTEVVKKLTGKSTKEQVNHKMILETKRLLLHSDLSVTEIAYQFNYADQSYFTRFFKNQTGQTPVEFRKQNNR